MSEIIIKDFTEWHKGKWYEVGTLSTMDKNESPAIIAKFLFLSDAKQFAKSYSVYSAGFHTITIQ